MTTGAVFISYASQDLESASRLADALRDAGIVVWFDKNALRAGDAWDSQIKMQVAECALFIPLISAHTDARSEGYFRGEWNLATRRMLNMSHDAAFLLPVVIDDTREANARVPEEFLQVQWSRLPGGHAPPSFAQRVSGLLDGTESQQHSLRAATHSRGAGKPRRDRKLVLGIVALVVVLAIGAVLLYGAKDVTEVASFAPPPNSVAVLAFANMSGDAQDEYFSDGLSEELLNTLVRVDKLQVAARTSSFSFKGQSVDIPTIGRKLNVGAVLEGGVRKADQKVRITAQLVNTVTGYQLWSQTFDRDLGDILSLQTEIAAHVASALRVVLLGQETQRLTDGGTENPEAFDYFLRARKAYREDLEQDSLQSARSLFDHAIDSDPEYALAWAHRAEVLALLAAYWSGNDTQERDELQRLALASANRAIEIAPTSGQAYASLATVLSFAGLDFIAIEAAYRRGIHFEPGNASLLLDYARLAADLGRPEALATASRAVTLNPLNPTAHSGKGGVLLYLRRFDEARAAFDEALRLRDDGIARNWRGVVEIASGRPAAALPYCEKDKHAWFGQYCLAIAYQQLGRTSEAAAMLKQLHSENGDSLAYQYAQIHAQWGRKAEALKWLATAAELRDSGLSDVKVDPLLDPIRKDPAFGRIVTSLGFPE